MKGTRFAVISDTHYVYPKAAQDSSLWNRQLLQQSELLAERLVAELKREKLDFILHVGDLTHEGDESSLAFAKETLDRIRVPYAFVLGNHDTALSNIKEVVQRFAGDSSRELYSVCTLGGYRILLLNSNYAHYKDSSESEQMEWRKAGTEYASVGFSQEQVSWLREVLSQDETTPTIAVTHHPVSSGPGYPNIKQSGPPQQRIKPGPASELPTYHQEVFKLLTSAPNVNFVFEGHWHFHELLSFHDTLFFKTASLVEYPFEFRVFSINEEVCRYEIRSIDPDGVLSQQSLVPETENVWVHGRSEDREGECSRVA